MDPYRNTEVKKNHFFNYKKAYTTAIIILIISIIISAIIISIYFEKNRSKKEEYDKFHNKIKEFQSKLNLNNISNENLTKKIYSLKNNTFNISNPTFLEAKNFLDNDKTDQINQSTTGYNCAHYSRDVNNNSEKQGIKCGYVIINPDESFSHAIIAFNTTDEGLVFFEPQNDRQVNLTKGKDYWTKCLNPPIQGKEEFIVKNYMIYW